MKKLNLNWVTEIIGEEYRDWKKGDIVTIQAQTGTGKTYFITGDKTHDGLIDFMDEYEKMVYICNRTELKRQIKLDLLKKFNKELPYQKDANGNLILDSNNRPILDNGALDNITQINKVVVTSYHAISDGKLENIYSNADYNLDEFNYIIADECHFFMNDAGFNQKSYLALEELVMTNHRNAVKIFISATMDEVKSILNKQLENQRDNLFGDAKNFKIYDYTTGIDYSYLNIGYFKNIKDIGQLIKNDRTDEKWMVFVTSKKSGGELYNQLQEYKISSSFIYSNMSNMEKKRITADSRFDCKVLISTKCLDNGINIKDSKVKNMVVMSYDKTTFIQEIGRVRFKITEAPTINLYIPMLYKKTFLGKIVDNYNPKIEDINLFCDNIKGFQRKYNNDTNKIPVDIFYLSKNNDWKLNILGVARVHRDKDFASQMVDDFNNNEFAYIEQQLEWLKLEDTFNKTNLIEGVVDIEEIESLQKYLQSIIGKKLFDDEQQIISDLVIGELMTISKKVDYRTKKLKPTTLEKILIDQLGLKYKVSESTKETKGEKRGKRYIIITKM